MTTTRLRSSEPIFDGSLRAFTVLLYLAILILMARFWPFAAAEGWKAQLYLLISTASYAALYVLIPTLVSLLAGWLLPAPRLWRRRAAYLAQYLGGTLMLFLIYADYRLYELYEFHFNGFVWNLLTTPGGFAALGMTDTALLTGTLQIGALFVATALAFWLIHRHLHARNPLSHRILLSLTGLLLFLLVAGEGVYAYSTHTGQEKLLQVAETVPFRLHAQASKLFKRLGIPHSAMGNLRIAGGKVAYPASNLASAAGAARPNIIVLVGESFRWDLLTPEITPNLWRLAGESSRFKQHYSGGNRTRMGLFSMFYGLYAPYWYSFERQNVAPALMNFVREHDYQLALHTSQSFDYPELRHTLFAGVPEAYMQELKKGEPWKRDRQNIDDLIGKLDKRDRARPFFGFMFFESTHAPYTFPEEAVIRPDYIKDLDYMRMDLAQNIEQIHARYINAAHHLDAEAGRLIDYLRRNGMLDNTIVLFTGDHGEEFMENGHWGHGHGRSFPEQQIHVPLVLHMPGQRPAVVEHRTSHLQIAPTLLEALGVTQDAHTYSSARNLREALPYFVAGDYDYMTVFDARYKITFPFTGSDFFRYTVRDEHDLPVEREKRDAIVADYREQIDAVVAESRRFVR